MTETNFRKSIKGKAFCDICGKEMLPLYGCGFDHDRLICPDRDCGAEIVFPTTTDPAEGAEQ